MGQVAVQRDPNHIVVVKVKARCPILKFTRFLRLLHKILLRTISLRFALVHCGSIRHWTG
jgi:hypothetical protein